MTSTLKSPPNCPKNGDHLWEKLIKIGAKVVTHSRYMTFQMAEVAVPRKLYAAILRRIRRFSEPTLVPG
jgi:hypothetical protein